MSSRALLIITNDIEILEEFEIAHIRVLIQSLLPCHLLIGIVLNNVADLGSKYLFALSIRYILVICAWSLVRLVLSLELVVHVFDVGISKGDLAQEDVLKVLGH